MKASERRQKILHTLSQTTDPISASTLAKALSVSRQIIVGDVAILRANQHDILSTPKGYILPPSHSHLAYVGKIACLHGPEEAEKEMRLIVQEGGIIEDVSIEHPIYGLLTSSLNIQTEKDIQQFMTRIEKSKAGLLSDLTQGIHLHTISCASENIFDRIKAKLAAEGILLTD